jgi:hypothetical protein
MNTSMLKGRRLAVSWMTLALLSACGGGGGGSASAPLANAAGGGSTATGTPTAGVGTGGTGSPLTGVGTGGTGSYAQGTITGFGSIIVNGVRYEDNTARVTDDDGASRSRDDLKLGMTVEVRASAPTVDAMGVARATAAEVRFSRSLTGPISSVNTATGTLVIFGQTVLITSTTIFDGVVGLAALQAGQVVEVYAQTDAQGRQVATRIERKDAASSAGASNAALRLSGAISNLSTDRLQFRLGTVTILLNSPLSATLANGSEVRVVARATTTEGTLTALSVQPRSSALSADVSTAEIEGYVTSFMSASAFSVNGVPVVINAGTKVEGLATNLKLGAKVEVEGTVVAGVITATKLEIKSAEDSGSSSNSGSGSGSSGSGGSSGSSSANFEIHGSISALNTAAMSFVVRSLTVTWDNSTEFKGGTAATLANGRNVEVKAVRGADGTTLKATRISFED